MLSYKKTLTIFFITTILSYTSAIPDINIPPVNSQNTTNQTCHLCNDIVEIIQAEIKIANGSIAIIEDVIRAFCHTLIFPSAKKECFFILNSLQQIINWLIQGLTPNDICKKLGLCK
jgi:hypothetical protein